MGTPKYIQPVSAVATSQYDATVKAENAFDPSTILTGTNADNGWHAVINSITNIKLNAAYADVEILKRLVINNAHNTGGYTTRGAKDVILYGTNVEAAYLNTVYANLDDLTELHSFQLRQHAVSDVADPQEIALPTITQAFKYYVFRIVNNWGDQYLGIRQIDMYFEDTEGLLYTKQGGHWEESLEDYVKVPVVEKYVMPTGAVATTKQSADMAAVYCFDSAASLTGVANNASWSATPNVITNQKLNAAFLNSSILKRLIINNYHHSGTSFNYGAKDIILYGTNVEAAYLNTVYANLDDLTELHSFQLRAHVASDIADPQEVALPVITQPFKYYVFRVAKNWGGTWTLGIRQIDMYFEKEPWQPSQQNYIKLGGVWQ